MTPSQQMDDHLNLAIAVLSSYGVHCHADLLRNASSSSENEATTLQLWKATHDVIFLYHFILSNATLHQADIQLGWREFSKRGPDAVRFDVIKSFVQDQLLELGYRHQPSLSDTASSKDLLIAFLWLVAKSEIIERHVTNVCREALQDTPLAGVRGNRVWSHSLSHKTDTTTDITTANSNSSSKKIERNVSDATHRIASQCGTLWHAVRDMAAVEERRTLILRRLCEHQARLRSTSNRLLLPIEIEVGIASNELSERTLLDNRITKLRHAVQIEEKAVQFWEWCQSIVVDVKEKDKDSEDSGNSEDRGNSGDSVEIENEGNVQIMKDVEKMIQELGLVLRKP